MGPVFVMGPSSGGSLGQTWYPHSCACRTCFLYVLFLATAAGTVSAQDTATLELREEISVALPPHSDWSGVSGTSTGSIAAWSRQTGSVVVTDGGRFRPLNVPSAHPIGAAFVGKDTVEIVDSHKGLIFTVAGQGLDSAGYELAAGVDLIEARWVAGSWYAWGKDSTGVLQLVELDPNGSARLLMRDTLRVLAEEHIYTSLGNGLLLLSSAVEPYDALRIEIEGTGEPTVRARSVSLDPLLAMQEDPGYWIGMPLIELGPRYVRTFINAHTDERLTVVLDEEGNVLSQHRSDLPLAFVDVIPESHILLATRHTNQLEVVGYRWKWVDSPHSKGGKQ